MRRLIKVFLVLLLSTHSFAQPDTSKFFLHDHSFKISTLPLVDWINTSARFSYEVRAGNRFGFQFGGGIAYNLWNANRVNETIAPEIGGLVNLELRCYFQWYKVSEGPEPFFVGLRGSYYNHHKTMRFSYIHEDSLDWKTPTSRHFVRQEKEVWGMYIIFGGAIHEGVNFFHDITLGVGTIYRRVDNYTQDSWGRPRWGMAIRYAAANGESFRWWTPAFFFNYQIGLGWSKKNLYYDGYAF